ncbi:energy transducer TonB family protein [Nannocystaceae bacterium ST9]
MQRREPIPPHMWAGFLLAALLVNGWTLVEAGDALGHALEQDVEDEEEEVTPFEMVEPDQPDHPDHLVAQQQFDERTPDDASRIAESDSDPDSETKARNQPERPGAQPQREGQQSEGQPQPDAQPQPRAPVEGEAGEANDMHEAPDGQQAKSGKPIDLGGSTGALRAAFGTHGTHDDLRDIDEGETNVLKTKRNLYASFFNRLRDRVAEHWEPEDANKAADPNQRIYGTTARTTVLWVQLDDQGKVVKIVVKQACGADHLDEEAIRALKAASPFPNPPEGLADSSGYIEFDFGFTLDFVEGPRIFRYQR